MKLRHLFFIGLVILSTNFVFAQKGGIISVGATPGLSYMLAQNTYFLNENAKELDYKPKFSYHIFVEGGYNFKEQHGLLGFASYCVEGQKYKDDFKWKQYPALIGTHTKNVDFKYMGFGALYRYSPTLPGQREHIRTGDYHWRMKVVVGFEVDVLLKASMDYKIDLNNSGNIVNYGYPIPPALGGYGQYEPNTSTDYKSYFKPVQGVGVIRYGFDYVFKNNMFFGVAFEVKVGMNDINAKAYREHPKYKASRNYFFGLNLQVGYTMNKNKSLINPNGTYNKKKDEPKVKVKHQGGDRNKEVDTVDRKTKKRIKKGLQ
ncbi:MAG: hypothetical protein KA174_02400 [Chitinophagales bacterium]|jgi:hypothetical protein|nr:hypothetical protein [Chitinophagales bacterium]